MYDEVRLFFRGTQSQKELLRSAAVHGSERCAQEQKVKVRVIEQGASKIHSVTLQRGCRAEMRVHARGAADVPAARRRSPAACLVRVCLAAATLAITASTTWPLDRPAPLAWVGGPCVTRLRQTEAGVARRTRLPLCRMVTRGTPEKGEVRNPWGRAGKPETRILRQQEADQVAELRAQAWSQALRRNSQARGRSDRKDDSEVNANGVDVSITEDIKDFHERACRLLRENGGRMNSLTFTYKWEQHYGESLITFLSRQRLTVAEMLKQSNIFWVVDMPGEHDGAGQMQIYILNEKNLRQENARETLGEQVPALPIPGVERRSVCLLSTCKRTPLLHLPLPHLPNLPNLPHRPVLHPPLSAAAAPCVCCCAAEQSGRFGGDQRVAHAEDEGCEQTRLLRGCHGAGRCRARGNARRRRWLHEPIFFFVAGYARER
jgi:hypothetical protein